MVIMMRDLINKQFNIPYEVIDLCDGVLNGIKPRFEAIDRTAKYNQLKVLSAFQKNRVTDAHFGSTSGYGYDDLGREVIDRVYADVFGCEDVLVRHNIINGTHAISLCLYAVLRPNDKLLSVTGTPYDTLEEVIGIRGKNCGSLKDMGVQYSQIDLINGNGEVDCEKIASSVDASTKSVLIQKSKGYSFRQSLTNEKIGNIINEVKRCNPNTVCIVDNCYGEFVETSEPTNYGADLVAGSLIKNPGGGIAPTGGYIAGRKDLVELAAYRLNSVGLGKHVGATLGFNKPILQGLFLAPHTVGEATKTALFCGAVFKKLGYEVSPDVNDYRSDIIQAIKFGSAEGVIKFCQGIQKGAPIDSFVSPEPWNMPGYESQVIMAAGAFTQGASIELSADGPIKPPYIAYMQGGLTFDSAYIGVLQAATTIAQGAEHKAQLYM